MLAPASRIFSIVPHHSSFVRAFFSARARLRARANLRALARILRARKQSVRACLLFSLSVCVCVCVLRIFVSQAATTERLWVGASSEIQGGAKSNVGPPERERLRPDADCVGAVAFFWPPAPSARRGFVGVGGRMAVQHGPPGRLVAHLLPSARSSKSRQHRRRQ